jgi:hypothetical protein
MTDEKVNLTIQVDKSLRDSFKTMCNSQDTDVSKEIRNFMRQFIKKNGQQDLFKK